MVVSGRMNVNCLYVYNNYLPVVVSGRMELHCLSIINISLWLSLVDVGRLPDVYNNYLVLVVFSRKEVTACL